VPRSNPRFLLDFPPKQWTHATAVMRLFTAGFKKSRNIKHAPISALVSAQKGRAGSVANAKRMHNGFDLFQHAQQTSGPHTITGLFSAGQLDTSPRRGHG